MKKNSPTDIEYRDELTMSCASGICACQSPRARALVGQLRAQEQPYVRMILIPGITVVLRATCSHCSKRARLSLVSAPSHSFTPAFMRSRTASLAARTVSPLRTNQTLPGVMISRISDTWLVCMSRGPEEAFKQPGDTFDKCRRRVFSMI